MRSNVYFCALILLGLSLTGCLKERQNLELNGDGSGSLTIQRTFVGQFGQLMAREYGGRKMEITENSVIRFLADLKEEYPGVKAWTAPKVEFKEGKMHLAAIGYFENIGEVSERREMGLRSGKLTTRSFKWEKTTEKSFKLTMTFSGPTARVNKLKGMKSAEDRKIFIDNQVRGISGLFPQFSTDFDIESRAKLTVGAEFKALESGACRQHFDLKTMRAMLESMKTTKQCNLTLEFESTERPKAFSEAMLEASKYWEGVLPKVLAAKKPRKKKNPKPAKKN